MEITCTPQPNIKNKNFCKTDLCILDAPTHVICQSDKCSVVPKQRIIIANNFVKQKCSMIANYLLN